MEKLEPEKNLYIFLLLSFSGVFIWSGISPNDRFTWVLEVLPAMLALAVLLATYHRFRFTRLAYLLMWGHALILLVGAHYTYAEMPLFNWFRDWLTLSRNHYDRVGHLAQGFVPAIVAREILLRTTPLRPGKMLFFLVVSICLAASAFYEFIEWWVALATGDAGEKFLGTQGDCWDTQGDMFMCFLGAILAQLLLARRHDRELPHPVARS